MGTGIIYENGDYWVTAQRYGKTNGYAVYKSGATVSTRVAQIGYEGAKGIKRAIEECDRRAAADVGGVNQMATRTKSRNGTKQAGKSVIPKTWIAAKVRRNAKGQVQLLIPRKANPTLARKRNVAAGFMDEEGLFHPIRASYDYSRGRAGEGKKRAAKRKPARKTARRRR